MSLVLRRIRGLSRANMGARHIAVSADLSRRMAVMSFVCACMIVAIHCTPAPLAGSWQWWVANLLGADGLCRIAVPWFFVASGFFFAGHIDEEGWYRNAICKRLRTLMIPFIAWALIGLAVRYCIWYGARECGYACGIENPIANGFWCALLKVLGFDLSRINIGPIWYLRMLFVLVVVSPVICRFIRRFGMIAPFLLWVGYGAYDTGGHFSDFWEYLVSLRGIAYFSLGIVWRIGLAEVVLGYARRHVIWVGVAGVSLLVLNVIARSLGCCYVENFLDFLMVLPLFAAVLGVLAQLRLPTWCWENAFAIYVLHGIFLLVSIAILVALNLRVAMAQSLAIALGRFMFAVGASLAVALLLKKLFPKVAYLLFGGR